MAARTFRRIIEQLGELPGVTTVQFSGFGEPMAHPAFFGLVGLAKGAGYAVEVVTNGLLLDAAAAEQLVNLRVDRLVVSLDAVDAEGIAGLHAGSFPAVYANLKRLHRLRVARGVTWPELGLAFVATKRNVAELPALRRLAPELGFSSILVTNLVPCTPELDAETLYERWTTAPRQRPPSPWNPCVDLPFTDAHSAAYGVLRRLLDSGAHLRLNGVDVAGTGPRCRFVTEGRFAIGWDGRVSPCLPLLHTHTYYFRGEPKRVRAYAVGNVNEAPLRELWRAEGYRRFRERVRAWEFAPCIDCGGCDLRESNEADCFGDEFPRCGECLWAAGLVQCP
jgi:MoaA/NifB/PqqE/SkfB family radical SAM enzyme